jgi:hypothetical protein
MGLFDGLFPAAKEYKDSLFSADSRFRRHRNGLEDAGTGKKAAQFAHDQVAGPSEAQVWSCSYILPARIRAMY